MTSRSIFLAAFLGFALLGCETEVLTSDNSRTTTGASGGETNTGDPPSQERRCGGIAGLPCGDGQFCDLGAQCHMPDAMGTCRTQPTACTREFRPVCGCNGRTYPNGCTARSDGTSVLHEGPCEAVAPTTGGADRAEGETCGTRGTGPCAEGLSCIHPVTAACGETDAPGTCERRPQACTMDYNPVCGCNGQTYSNACAAASAGVSVRARGECAH